METLLTEVYWKLISLLFNQEIASYAILFSGEFIVKSTVVLWHFSAICFKLGIGMTAPHC